MYMQQQFTAYIYRTLTACNASYSSRINFKILRAILAVTDSCGRAETNMRPCDLIIDISSLKFETATKIY